MRPTPLLTALLLAACASDQTPPPAIAPPPPPPAQSPPAEAGLGRILGQDARALEALFGRADLDLKEGAARKLQYRGPACTLDAYLYPARAGEPPRVTWIDARTPAGADIDRASCIAALVRRAPTRP